MVICCEIHCYCFLRGLFDLKKAPFQSFLKKDAQGYFCYDDGAIGEQENYDAIHAEIENWTQSICVHDYPRSNNLIRLPDDLSFMKEEWASILPEASFKNLIPLFRRGLEWELKGNVINEMLKEVRALKEASFSVVELFNKQEGETRFAGISGIDRMHLLATLGEHISYLDNEGFNIVEGSAWGMLNATLKTGISVEEYVNSHTVIFNATQFSLEKEEGGYCYTNLRSGLSVTTTSNMADGFDCIKAGTFAVKYTDGFKIQDDFDVLPQLEAILREAQELDAWIDAW